MKRTSPAKNTTPRDFLLGILLGLVSLIVLALALKLKQNSLLPPAVVLSQITQQKAATPSAKTASPSAKMNNLNEPTSPEPSAANARGIPILMYHYVGYNPNPETDRQRNILSIIPEKLDAQFAWLSQQGFTPVTLDTLFAIFYKKAAAPPRPVVLTFDDGYIDFYFNAFPILRKYGFHAVSFIPTGLVGKPAYMSWDQIKEIQGSGLVDFEAHTVNHANLPGLTYARMFSELINSKQQLEAQVGRPVNFIAYPYGASNNTVWKAALEAGFVGGVGTWPGKASSPSINMPRLRINGGISLAQFAKLVGN